jgi:GntR family transcriptional regulator
LDIKIDPAGREPLHQQIADQIRHQIAAGKLLPGERLTPVRALAQRLALSVATVAKAYAELERIGVIIASVGRGSFVADQAYGPVASFREDRLRDLLGHAVLEALSLGYSLEQIEGALALQWARWRELRSSDPYPTPKPVPAYPEQF